MTAVTTTLKSYQRERDSKQVHSLYFVSCWGDACNSELAGKHTNKIWFSFPSLSVHGYKSLVIGTEELQKSKETQSNSCSLFVCWSTLSLPSLIRYTSSNHTLISICKCEDKNSEYLGAIWMHLQSNVWSSLWDIISLKLSFYFGKYHIFKF